MVLVSDKPSNYVGILQTKLSHREGHEARRGGLETMPLDQHIEGGYGERQARLKIGPAPMHDLFEMADERQHREDRFNKHAVLPLTALTQFEVGRIAFCGMEGRITQDDHASIDLANQPLKGVICHIGRATVPPHHQAILVHQQAELAPDNPAMVGQTFPTNLLRAAALVHGVDQLDAIDVDDAEHGRRGQEDLGPVLMGPEEAKKAGSLGESGKQRPIVARQPAIKRPVADACERMQQAQGDHLTGLEVGLGVFGPVMQLFIDVVE